MFGGISMNDMIKVLEKAREFPLFGGNEEIKNLIAAICAKDSSLIVDWDDDAGEEWVRLCSKVHGKVFMMHTQLRIVFIRKSYDFDLISDALEQIAVIFTDNYSADEWYIDLFELKNNFPEISWHACEEAVNPDCFSLDDLYYATV